jgi:hypothetical protein
MNKFKALASKLIQNPLWSSKITYKKMKVSVVNLKEVKEIEETIVLQRVR